MRRPTWRRSKTSPAPVVAATSPTGHTRRGGILRRTFGRLALHQLGRALSTPAAAPIVAVVVVGVFAALAVGALLGAALVVASRAEA